jgi:hypothetical protein
VTGRLSAEGRPVTPHAAFVVQALRSDSPGKAAPWLARSIRES